MEALLVMSDSHWELFHSLQQGASSHATIATIKWHMRGRKNPITDADLELVF